MSSLATILDHQKQENFAGLLNVSDRPQGVISRRKLIISLAAAFLLVLGLVLGFGRNSHAMLGASTAATPAASPADNSDNNDSSAQSPAAAESSTDSSAADDTVTTDSSSINVNLNSSSTTSSDPAASNTSTSMTVNGQEVPVKNPNSIHKVIKNTGTNGNTEVNINVQNNSSGGSM